MLGPLDGRLPSGLGLGFCVVIRRSAKREEKMFQRCSPSLSRMKSAACGSSFELAFSDLGR